MYCWFWHIFGWWYSAGYYSYMWAEILEADIFARIKKMWMFDRETWEKFIKTILWQWTRKKALQLFYDFMGREVDNKAFMERKWI
jgi:oligopeptidase A